MPSWAAGAAGTFAISAVSAYLFLLLRCQGIGYPFGPQARWWALAVVLMTAVVATGLGVAAVAVSDHLRAVYIGILLPSGLWLGKRPSAHRRRKGAKALRTLAGFADAPLRRMDDSMGDDMQNWCDRRAKAASVSPELTYDAAQHYYLQVVKKIKDRQKRDDLESRLSSIKHKVAMARQARLGTAGATDLKDDLDDHPSTRGGRSYSADDPDLLASRLESDAENELHLLLARIYQLRYRKLVIYRGFKPA